MTNQGGVVAATASGTFVFNGQTYAVASSLDTFAFISRYQWSDPVRTLFQRIWTSGGYQMIPDAWVEELACVGAPADSAWGWTVSGTAAYAIDPAGTYHLHVSLALDTTLETTIGQYGGTGYLRFSSTFVPSFEFNPTFNANVAVIPLTIPVTVETAEESAAANLLVDLSFFIIEGQQSVYVLAERPRCAF